MVIEIRLAAPEDAAAVCQVLCRSITECCRLDHRDEADTLKAWLGNKQPANVASWIAAPANHTLVAEVDGQLSGVALLTQAGKLSLCYVLPEAQGKGVGKALLCGAEAQARIWDIKVVKLHSTVTASTFFSHHGYLMAGKEKTCFGLECDFFWKKLDGEAALDAAKRKRFCNCSGG